MRFPYRAYRVHGGPAGPEEQLRPIIPVRAIGLSGDSILYGLLDTGAEMTLLDESFLERLDVHIGPDDWVGIFGVTGRRVEVPYGTIDFSLATPRSPAPCRWRAKVGFVRRPVGQGAIFGYEGFLEHFSASFHGPRKFVTLTPRPPLPMACMPVL